MKVEIKLRYKIPIIKLNITPIFNADNQEHHEIFLVVIFVSVFVPGHGQSLKLGIRTGVSFSNFHAHYSPRDFPYSTISGNPHTGSPVIIDPNLQNTSLYYYETDFVKDLRIGFFSYLNLQWEIKRKLSAEIGLGYTQKGISINYTLNNTNINSDNNRVETSHQFNRNLRLDYISIPITLHYKLGTKERFYILGGFYNSLAVKFLIKESLVQSSQTIYQSVGETSTSSTHITTDAYATRFDAGFIAGAGFNLPLTEKMIIGIDIRSAIGLINIPRRYEEYGFQSFKNTTKNISFETGLKLQYNLN